MYACRCCCFGTMHLLRVCVLLPLTGWGIEPPTTFAGFQSLTLSVPHLFKVAPVMPRAPVIQNRMGGRTATQFGLLWALGLGFIPPARAPSSLCPTCFGNIPSCTFGATGGDCPAVVVPRENADIITGASTGSLKLAGCLAPRFLRMLSRSELTTVTTLANRPPPGTAITFDASTKLKDLVIYLKQGLVSKEQLEVSFADFIDAEADAVRKKELRENVKFLMNAAESADLSGDDDPGGLYSWLLGMVVSFVLTGTVVTASALSSGPSTTSGTAKHKTKIPRPKTVFHLLEILNLYVMFFVALGLGPASLITSFIQCVVIDTIVVRKYEWVVAFELMLVLFRKIENSTGSKYNLGNVIEEVHLNSALDEAMEAAKIFFPLFFRSGGGKLRENETHPDQDDKKGKKKFNGKFNKDQTCRACAVFNSGGEHKPHMLENDGTCRFIHVCDHWVSDQGPGGICRNKAGKPGHNRRDCDNPNKCDSKLQ